MTEELKIIMDAIAQLGQAGKEAFIWWLIVKYLVSYLMLFVGFCIGAYVVFRIARMLYEAGSDTRSLRHLAVLTSTENSYGYVDREKLYEKVRAALEKQGR